VAIRYGVSLGGITEVALMHLDTLSGFDRIGICTAYKLGEVTLEDLPADSSVLAGVEPVVEVHTGWTDDLRGCQTLDDLPAEARRYIERIETLAGAPITLISVGPDRSQTLFRGDEASAFAPIAATMGS
jgi:adenylosuccinate synthase